MGGIASMLYAGSVDAAAGTMVNGAVSSLSSTFEMQEGLDLTLYSLQQEVVKIKCAIDEARTRRITNQELLEWLSLIIKAYYIGNYYCRTLKHRHSLPLMIESECSSNLVIRPAKRPRTITTLLFGDEELKKLRFAVQMLKTVNIPTFLSMVYAQPERPMKTYLYMDHNKLFNRDKERQQVMDFLFESSNAGESTVSILPIIGEDGVGKASLALHCFEDPKVQNHFSLKIYSSCLQFHNSETKSPVIFSDIVGNANNRYKYNCDDTGLMVVMLKQMLSSERFLLLLDKFDGDVNLMVWNILWDCLRCGKQGSKVIFVSKIYSYERNRKVVNPEAVMPVMLDFLPEDEYWLFFKEHAFGSVDPVDHPELEKIGRGIAKEVNGSFWGAKILGELLRDNLNVSFWSNILHGGFLSPLASSKDIFPVLHTMFRLLPKSLTKDLKVNGYTTYHFRPSSGHDYYKKKNFRELMVLAHNHCTPLIKEEDEDNGVKIPIYEHVFLNEYKFYVMLCGPLEDENELPVMIQ